MSDVTDNLRHATVEDAAAIARVHVKSWQWAYQGQMPQEHLDGLSIQARTDLWQRNLGEAQIHQVLVAVVDDEIVGFCCYGTSRDVDLGDDVGEISAIYVLEHHAGSGLGRSLWERAVRELDAGGMLRTTVWVLASNDRARGFYERLGMRLDGAAREDADRGFLIREVRLAGPSTG